MTRIVAAGTALLSWLPIACGASGEAPLAADPAGGASPDASDESTTPAPATGEPGSTPVREAVADDRTDGGNAGPTRANSIFRVDDSGWMLVGDCPSLDALSGLGDIPHEVLVKGDVAFQGGYTAVVGDEPGYAESMRSAYQAEARARHGAVVPPVDFGTQVVLAGFARSTACVPTFELSDAKVVVRGGNPHLDITTVNSKPCSTGCFETTARGAVVSVPRSAGQPTVCVRMQETCDRSLVPSRND